MPKRIVREMLLGPLTSRIFITNVGLTSARSRLAKVPSQEA